VIIGPQQGLADLIFLKGFDQQFASFSRRLCQICVNEDEEDTNIQYLRMLIL